MIKWWLTTGLRGALFSDKPTWKSQESGKHKENALPKKINNKFSSLYIALKGIRVPEIVWLLPAPTDASFCNLQRWNIKLGDKRPWPSHLWRNTSGASKARFLGTRLWNFTRSGFHSHFMVKSSRLSQVYTNKSSTCSLATPGAKLGWMGTKNLLVVSTSPKSKTTSSGIIVAI